LESSLKRPRHFKGRRRDARDGHERVRIQFEDFFGLVREDGIPRGGAMIARNDYTLGAMKGKDRGGLDRWRSRGRNRLGLGERVLWQQGQEIAVHWPVR